MTNWEKHLLHIHKKVTNNLKMQVALQITMKNV